jgi:hypothetical protein
MKLSDEVGRSKLEAAMPRVLTRGCLLVITSYFKETYGRAAFEALNSVASGSMLKANCGIHCHLGEAVYEARDLYLLKSEEVFGII